MKKDRYLELIRNNDYEEHLSFLYDTFEHFIENKVEFTNTLLNQTATVLDNDDLREHLKKLKKLVPKKEKIKLLYSMIDSLQKNITGFVSMSRDGQDVGTNRPRKFSRVLASYVAVSRMAIRYNEIFNVISDQTHLGKKIVLVVGMIKLSEDDILVNKEIEELYLSSNNQSQYCVIPLFECSTKFFMETTRWIRPEILHLAGHGSQINGNGKYVIHFVDSNMTSKKFSEVAGSITELIFINCCYSFQFIFPKDSAISSFCVLHDGTLDSSVALNFSRNFYNALWVSPINSMNNWFRANGLGTCYKWM